MFHSCQMIARAHLHLNGSMGDSDGCRISVCCEPLTTVPHLSLCTEASVEKQMEDFFRLRISVLNEHLVAEQGDVTQIQCSKMCSICNQYKAKDWKISERITAVNFALYPAPCQSHCIYCGTHTGFNKSAEVKDTYDKAISLLEYAEIRGYVETDAVWQLASGEISIHPYKDRLLKLIWGKRARIYSNCFLFDKDILDSLRSNPDSYINFSIDAGTAESWRKVKGVDNFDLVLSNLMRYSEGGGHVMLKYIIIPGVNDSSVDYYALMNILKLIHSAHLRVSRDHFYLYHPLEEYNEKLYLAAARLLALCKRNCITAEPIAFSTDEWAQIAATAQTL